MNVQECAAGSAHGHSHGAAYMNEYCLHQSTVLSIVQCFNLITKGGSTAGVPGLSSRPLTSHTYLLEVTLARCADDVRVASLRVAVQLEAPPQHVVHGEGWTLAGVFAAAAGALLLVREEGKERQTTKHITKQHEPGEDCRMENRAIYSDNHCGDWSLQIVHCRV
ncbi:hypothetical protein E2C01_028984 [Portunus trituberculatus]|uniref:Uncharacterized protein n=1 Tax=Portunus trituberculatus TaxID=210409 RepID=A0A5B7ER04_PORTR|nr:hypothetical protein [Portunus trituberculatus]